MASADCGIAMGAVCMCIRASLVTPATPLSAAAAMMAGQYFTSIEPERFISLTVDCLFPTIRETAVGPPSASISSGTVRGESSAMLQSTEFLLTQSTGFLFATHGKPQAMGERHARLIEARKRAGFTSALSAAKRHAWKPSTYASHENGQTPLPVEAAYDYARAFKVSPGWLLTGEGERKRKAIEIRGYVGAGAEIIPVDDAAGDDIELPPGAPPNTTAVIVRGESMYPRYFDGEKLFYLPDQRSPDELIGRECVVQLADGRVMVKILRRGSRRRLYNLESWNAPLIEDQKVEWAAPVRWRG